MSVDSSQQQLEKADLDQELLDLQPIKRDKEDPLVDPISITSNVAQSPLEYRLYKWRFVGVVGLVCSINSLRSHRINLQAYRLF